MKILGISAFYHDSAAVLLVDGEIIAAAQEERFSRRKYDESFPIGAIRYCLSQSEIELTDIDAIVFYEKPFVTFERIMHSITTTSPYSLSLFLKAVPLWLKKKINLRSYLKGEFSKNFALKQDSVPKIYFSSHHLSHAAAAFFPSPFEDAAVLCLDGVGEWSTTSLWHGSGSNLKPLQEIRFPNSLGLFYSAFSYYCGFRVNSGEYKFMGLAPFGKPKYVDLIKKEFIEIFDDGSFSLNMKHFAFEKDFKMITQSFSQVFNREPRPFDSSITELDMDIAASVQIILEEAVLKLAKTARSLTGSKNLCLAGGVALNCVANGKLKSSGLFEQIWVQPAAGDCGGSLGAALSFWHLGVGKNRKVNHNDLMKGSLLGPEFSAEQIEAELRRAGLNYDVLTTIEIQKRAAQLLSDGAVVGWMQGRMEYGPRALGNRSILGDPRNKDMQKKMNLKIKFRESFRPFAPVVTRESVEKYFLFSGESPYMGMVAGLRPEIRYPKQSSGNGLAQIDEERSHLPAITHIDYSARLQTVDKETNPIFYGLLQEFERETDFSVLINTSFNVRGEPIVCTPWEAISCFARTEIDILVIGSYWIEKKNNHLNKDDEKWKAYVALD